MVLGVSLSRKITNNRQLLSSLDKDNVRETVLSINRDESILVVTKLGEVRLTYLGSGSDDCIKIGVVSPRQIEIYSKERTRRQRYLDDKLYQKELAFWREELRRNDRKRRAHENLMCGKVDKMLLEYKDHRSISKECGVSNKFVAKRQLMLEKNGSFETPLFDM